MKRIRYSKMFLYAAFSILFMLIVPAMAQDASTASGMSETWDENTAILISFRGDTADISGDGAELSDGILVIDKAGTYVLTGTWSSGQVRIDAGKKDTVRLILNGVSIHCPDNAPLYAPQAGKVILTLVGDTKNALSDGSTYTYLNGETEPDAALYVQDSLTINGRGALSVTANNKHGIVSKDDLLIENGIISVTAADVGIRGRDTLTISGGEINITAKGDALQSNNGDNPQKGCITLTGGTYHLISMKDGIQAESCLTISGGDYTLYTGGISPIQGELNPEEWQPNESSDGAPGKGLKSGSHLNITGGTFHLYCADDALRAGGKITIQGGIFEIATKDDGLRAVESVDISGGKLAFLTCCEGIDTANVSITSGEVTIKALGDGIDTTGSVILKGGTLYVSSPDDGKSGVVDYVESFLVSGCTLAASGFSGMVKAPNPDSKQPSFMISFSMPIKAGSIVDLIDDSGNTVLTCTMMQDFQTLLISAPGLVLGKNYTLVVNGETILSAGLNETVTKVSQEGGREEN